MTKKFISSFLVFLWFVASTIAPHSAYAATQLPISASSAILMDHSSRKIIYAKTPHKKRAPASTTKLLTSIVTIENKDLDAWVTIPGFVSSIEPSKAYLKRGERYRVRDLVRATLISSANDAAEVLAVAVGGSKAGFAKMMNAKVKSLGGKSSNFVNASGLPAKGQYSTAYDMALIMREAQKVSFVVKTLATKRMVIKSEGNRKIYLKNHNKMLFRGHDNVVGKTGWTRKARHCFVGQISKSNRKVFVAMLGSNSLWKDLTTLMKFQFGFTWFRIKQNKKLWARKSDVKKIQKSLRKSGFSPGPIDGAFGPKTILAIQKFQKSRSLRSDGVVGPATWAQLRKFS